MVYLLLSSWIERKAYEVSGVSCTKAEFLDPFSPSEARRAVAFHTIGLTVLILIVLVYLLMPPEAR